MVYAKADRRWAGADSTVVSLELLTVFLGAPLAAWICWGIARRGGDGDGMVGFWVVVLGVGELYGGAFFLFPLPFFSFPYPYPFPFFSLPFFYDPEKSIFGGSGEEELTRNRKTGFMTFCPEWLTGSPNLDASNFLFKWVYLFFFNMLWVVLPLYALRVAFVDIRRGMDGKRGQVREGEGESRKRK
jgi:hypothetical protein